MARAALASPVACPKAAAMRRVLQDQDHHGALLRRPCPVGSGLAYTVVNGAAGALDLAEDQF